MKLKKFELFKIDAHFPFSALFSESIKKKKRCAAKDKLLHMGGYLGNLVISSKKGALP